MIPSIIHTKNLGNCKTNNLNHVHMLMCYSAVVDYAYTHTKHEYWTIERDNMAKLIYFAWKISVSP